MAFQYLLNPPMLLPVLGVISKFSPACKVCHRLARICLSNISSSSSLFLFSLLKTHRPSFHLSNSQVHSHLTAFAWCPFLPLVASLDHLGLKFKRHLFRQPFLTTQVKSISPTPLSFTLYPTVLFYCLQSLYYYLKLLFVYMFIIYLHHQTHHLLDDKPQESRAYACFVCSCGPVLTGSGI